MSLAVLADHMASKGRGPDSMLIHMSPREVQGLQALAMKHGGSLTINPETGLPEAGILDKLLPAIIGFALAPLTAGTSLAFLGATPFASAMTVGALQTLRTGDLGKGIQAGLGAYGGAGLQAGLAGAGASALSGEATSLAANEAGKLAGEEAVRVGMQQGLSEEAINQLRMQAIDEAGSATARVATDASPFAKLSAGASQATSSPTAMGQFAKDNFKNIAYTAAPILADQAVTSKLPTTTTKPGMIRPYSFDPYGGTYTAGTPYEAMPTKAAEGGLMGMADGGYNPGQLNFAQRSEPVVRMADGGGVVALAAGGDYRSLTKDSSADDIASAYKQFTTASGGDTAANQQAAISYLTNLGIGQDKIGQAYGTYQASPTYTDYTQQNVTDYLTSNKDINIAEETARLNANPLLVNQAISQLGSGYLDPTNTTGGSGAQTYFDAFTNRGITADELYAANLALNPNYAFDAQTGAAGLAALQRAFDVAKQFDTYKYGAVGKTELEKDVDFLKNYDAGKFKGDRAQQIEDIARETGLSLNEAARRYDAARAAMKPVTPITTITGGTGTGVTTTPITYKTDGTNAPGGLESVLGLPPGVSGAGITTVNPNGTITTRPDLSLQMKDVRDTYEKGGGSLGVNKNLFVPKTQDELFARYKNTGGSKAALDYLMGKTPYSPTPYTPTGEIQKPYWESVGRFPENRSTKKYVFVDGKYQLNPDYVKPSYVLAGEKAAALTNQDKEPTESPGAGNKWTWNSADKKWEATPIGGETPITGQNDGGGGGEANGGLMAMASGGMAGQFDLGGYSDGGRLLRGPGDGVSDSIPATIGNKRPARLADGEFVVPARIVSELGNGSTEAGARKLYAMMDRVQKARRGTVGKGKVAKNSRSDKYLPA